MIISFIFNLYRNQNLNILDNLLGLFNWIPLFYCFWGFQFYLNTFKKRQDCVKLYLIGSIPLLIGGLLQYFFGIYGPFRFFNNLFIWFQKPLCFENLQGECSTGVTSVFSHPNYYASWLLIIFPFILSYLVLYFNKKNIRKIYSISYSFLVTFSLIITASRNALLGLFISSYLSFINTKTKTFEILRKCLLTFLIVSIFYIFFIDKASYFQFLPPHLITKLDNQITDLMTFTRTKIFIESINSIFMNPFLGNGIPVELPFLKVASITHSHNIFLEVSLIYGLIPSFFMFTNILILFFQSFRNFFIGKGKIKLNSYFFDRSWCIAFMVIFIANMFDITYYDIKISISFWILLSGLKCILDKNNEKILSN